MNNTETIKALKAENKKLKVENAELEKRKKYGLVWEDKPEIFDKQSECAYPILRGKDDENYPNINHQTDTDNNQKPHILIEGDNYHTLSVLNVTHQNKIDVIYIDPPYNTGAKDWKYNNDFVDKEDKFRHSKWLSFMDKRLRLSKNLLADGGVICIAIDHYELFNLGCLCDEIFGEENKIGVISVIHKPEGRNQEKFFGTSNEYMFCYAKNKSKSNFRNVVLDEQLQLEFNQEDSISKFKLKNFIRLADGKYSSRENKPKFYYPIYVSYDLQEFSITEKEGYTPVFPITTTGVERTWKTTKETCIKRADAGEIVAKLENERIDIYEKLRESQVVKTHWIKKEYHGYHFGTKLLETIVGVKNFNFPKSLFLITDVLKLTARKNATILDFFAGSGTTAHAVLELNKQDGGNRQCILATNNENGICEDITYERVKRVIEGYTTPKGREVAGLGGQLHYLKTDFVPKDDIKSISDNDKIAFSHQVGVMLALKENTFDEVKSNKYYQVFTSSEKITGIYFSENIRQLDTLLDYLDAQNLSCCLYAYPELDEEDFRGGNITLNEIPEHILKIYQTIGAI